MPKYDVCLVAFKDDRKERAVLEICRVFSMQPDPARKIVESLPRVVKIGVDKETADLFAEALEAIGAVVEVRMAAKT